MFTFLLYYLFFISAFHCNIATTTNDPTTYQVAENGSLLEYKYGQIVHITLIIRHGDRSPDADMVTYPLDPHRNFSWAPLDGHLTNPGKQRLYDLGQQLKSRYRSILGDLFHRKMIAIHSSDVDRNIMSALCLMHGMYPATPMDTWRPNETWQPIPVHTYSTSVDNVMSPATICARIHQRKVNAHKSPESTKLYYKHKSTIDYIAKNSGLNLSLGDLSSTFRTLRHLKSSFVHEVKYNLTLPEWTKTIYPEPLKTIEEETIKIETKDPVWKRLSAGPLMKQIINDMTKKIEDATFVQLMHVYIGHEKTLEAAMSVFNLTAIQNGTRAYFGTVLAFELRKNNTGDNYLITLSLRNAQNQLVYYQKIPNCGFACPLDTFISLLRPYMPDNFQQWQAECQLSSAPYGKSLHHLWLTLVVSLFTFS